MNEENFYTFSEYMKKNGPLTANMEDYLEMIYRLTQETGSTRVSDVANALNVKPPSASSMMKKLTNKGLLVHKDYGTITLTKKGKMVAIALIERHQVVEDFLKILNVQDNLLDEVEKIEHTLNDKTLFYLKKLVNFLHMNPEIINQFHQHLSNKKRKQ